MTAEFSPSENWLLEQLRFDRAPAWSDSPDWNQVIAVAQREGLATILLARAGTFALPADARNQLETLRRQTRINNALLLMQLEEGLARFDADNIPAIVLKGAALSVLVYERATLRPMSDVDLLVRRGDFARAGELFRAAGFAPYGNVAGDDASTIRTQTLWLHPELPGGIELHWHLIDSGYYARRVPMEWFWEHTMDVPLGARRVRVFAPAAQLLHLAAHLELHHASAGWLWLYDIAALLHKFGASLDWDLVFDAARRFEWANSLRESVTLARATFGVSVPESADARLAGLRPTGHERLARVLAEPTAHQAAFLFDGLAQGSWRDKARYLGRSLFPAAEFMRVHGPIRNRRDLMWQYLLRLGRGLYRIPRALWAGMTQLWRAAR